MRLYNINCNISFPVSVQVREKLVIYTAETLHVVVIASSIAALAVGFVAGYLFSKRFHQQPQFVDTPFIEQHNHLNRYRII